MMPFMEHFAKTRVLTFFIFMEQNIIRTLIAIPSSEIPFFLSQDHFLRGTYTRDYSGLLGITRSSVLPGLIPGSEVSFLLNS
jgi:hypothetical protein